MKKYEKYIEPPKPATERTRLVARICDLCGAQGKNGFECGYYEINENEVTVTVKHKSGEQYPECGNSTLYDVDICPKCFKNKLIPWLESQGAKIEKEVCDW